MAPFPSSCSTHSLPEKSGIQFAPPSLKYRWATRMSHISKYCAVTGWQSTFMFIQVFLLINFSSKIRLLRRDAGNFDLWLAWLNWLLGIIKFWILIYSLKQEDFRTRLMLFFSSCSPLLPCWIKMFKVIVLWSFFSNEHTLVNRQMRIMCPIHLTSSIHQSLSSYSMPTGSPPNNLTPQDIHRVEAQLSPGINCWGMNWPYLWK